ncbi:MAG: TRAP transporter permease [Spirochaetales bacterium]|nr:TRAP transporter permease [Spirochaetales bacterium]
MTEKTSIIKVATAVLCFAFSIFHLYTALFGILTPILQGGLHLFTLLALGMLLYTGKTSEKLTAPSPAWYNIVLFVAVASVALVFLFRLSPDEILNRGVFGPSRFEQILGLIILLLVLEGTRRTVGLPIVLVALFFIVYALFGSYMPSLISHKGYSIWRLVDNLVWTTQGIFGVPIAVSSTFVIIFILFGSMLDKLGAGTFFINFAYALTGHRKGGPAQTAVIASGFMGSISGSSVSNVVTTGAFTIPLMKKTGYSAEYAAAVEAVASTGGQIMPPVMGAAAFVMADMLGLPYYRIALAALIPALLYFLSVSFMVNFQASKKGLKAVDKKDLPSALEVLKNGYYVAIPIIALVYFLFIRMYSPMRAGVFTIFVLIAVSFFWTFMREKRLMFRELFDALVHGAKIAVPVAMACASAGIVIGIVSLTGLGVRFTQLIISLSGGHLFPALLLTMLACLILGMGLPTTAAYIITSVLAVPALSSMGVPTLAAHFFILYFAIISFITPPVAISAFAAAGIAGSDSMKTGFTAFRIGIAGFIVPFMFVYGPSLLFIGDWWDIVINTIKAIVGVILLAGFLEGWFFRRLLPVVPRLILGASAVFLIFPRIWSGLVGLGLLLIAYLFVTFVSKSVTSKRA